MADPERRVTLFRAAQVLVELAGSPRPRQPVDAFAVTDGIISNVASLPQLQREHPAAELVDLGPRWVMPGLDDAHCHPTIAADELCHITLTAEEQRDPAAVTAAVSSAGRSNGWVKLVGWLEASTGGSRMDRHLLDQICPREPLILVHANGHSGYMNTVGLRRMGLVDEHGLVSIEVVPPGGWVEAAADGTATGRIFEQVLYDVAEPALARDPRQVALASFEDRLAAMEGVQHRYLARGVTSVTEALCSDSGWQLMDAVTRASDVPPRYSALVPVTDLALAERVRASSNPGLRLVGLKSFVDGALNGGTCLLSQSVQGGEPQQLRGAADIAEELVLAHGLGLQLGVHANGDAAVDVLLQAADAVSLSGRIEHGSFIRDDQIEAILSQGWSVVPFGSYIRQHGSRLAQTYGRGRMSDVIRHRTLHAAGITVAGSSDFPCADQDPWEGIWSCITRTTRDGEILGGDEAVSAEVALRMYTRGSAMVRPNPGLAGTLHPGAPADFITLDVDPRGRDGLEQMLTQPVSATFVGGRQAFGSERR